MNDKEIVKDPFDAQHIPFMNLELKDDNTFTFSIKSTIDEPDTTADGKPGMKKKVFRFEYDIDSRELTDVTDMEEESQHISRQQLRGIRQGLQPLLD